MSWRDGRTRCARRPRGVCGVSACPVLADERDDFLEGLGRERGAGPVNESAALSGGELMSGGLAGKSAREIG